MSEETDVILPDDHRSATKVKLDAWVDRYGYFFGQDERGARWSGATHVKCRVCEQVITKSRVICDPCHKLEKANKFSELEKHEWKGGYFYCEDFDKFYDDDESFFEDCVDAELSKDEALKLMVYLCEPQYFTELDESYFEDILPEDGDAPSEVMDAMEEFNKVLRKHIASYVPTNNAVNVDLLVSHHYK